MEARRRASLASHSTATQSLIALQNAFWQLLHAPGLEQGDPRFGDIRFGGYVFANIHNLLAEVPPEKIIALYRAAAEAN